MKKLRKFTGIFLVFVMIFTMTGITLAGSVTSTDGAVYSITAPDNQHIYDVYQIFTGTLSTGDVLSDIKWGKNGKMSGTTVTQGEAVPEEVLTRLTNIPAGSSENEILDVIKDYVNLEGERFGEVTYAAPLERVPAGYYLIKDRENSVPENDAYTRYIVKIVNDIHITPKADVPSVEKKILDTNDSFTLDGDAQWKDSADYDIGDNVPFQFTTQIVSTYDDYESYRLVFHDKQSKGLTFHKNSVMVYIDDQRLESGYLVEENVDHGDGEIHTFDIIFENLKVIEEAHAGAVIRVEYTSVLNENANIGSVGNPNEVCLSYSNNPYGDGTGTTPYDKVIAFTYEVLINKYDEERQDLDGAIFTLEKYMKAEGNQEAHWIEIKTIGADPNITHRFEFKGLDDGWYRLKETPPQGYNSIEPIYFKITAEHETLSNDPQLIQLKVLHTKKDDANVETETGKIDFTVNKDAGLISAGVINKAGIVLPETGGMGTGLFYILGGILMLGTASILISRRRLNR